MSRSINKNDDIHSSINSDECQTQERSKVQSIEYNFSKHKHLMNHLTKMLDLKSDSRILSSIRANFTRFDLDVATKNNNNKSIFL